MGDSASSFFSNFCFLLDSWISVNQLRCGIGQEFLFFIFLLKNFKLLHENLKFVVVLLLLFDLFS